MNFIETENSDSAQEIIKSAPTFKFKSDLGYIYAFSVEGSPLWKLGKTSNPQQRFVQHGQLFGIVGHDIKKIFLIGPMLYLAETERNLINRISTFADRHSREWFKNKFEEASDVIRHFPFSYLQEYKLTDFDEAVKDIAQEIKKIDNSDSAFISRHRLYASLKRKGHKLKQADLLDKMALFQSNYPQNVRQTSRDSWSLHF